MAGRPQKNRPNKTFLAQRLSELLGERNFSEFERENHLPHRTLQRIMDGADLRISTLSLIAKAVGKDIGYFVESADTAAPAPSPLPALKKFHGLSLKELLSIKTYLEKLLEKVNALIEEARKIGR